METINRRIDHLGRISIPKEMLSAMDIHECDKIAIECKDGALILKKGKDD